MATGVRTPIASAPQSPQFGRAELGLGLFEALALPTPAPAQLATIFKAMFSQAGSRCKVGKHPSEEYATRVAP